MEKIYEHSLYLKEEIAKQTHTITVPIQISNETLENVITDGINAIAYWGAIDNTMKEFETLKNSELCYEEKIFTLLMNKIPVKIIDKDNNNTVLELTLDKLLHGIQINYQSRPFDSDIENGDAITYDCIFQYALFGKIIYD